MCKVEIVEEVVMSTRDEPTKQHSTWKVEVEVEGLSGGYLEAARGGVMGSGLAVQAVTHYLFQLASIAPRADSPQRECPPPHQAAKGARCRAPRPGRTAGEAVRAGNVARTIRSPSLLPLGSGVTSKGTPSPPPPALA